MNPFALLVRRLGRGSDWEYECKGCGATFDVQYHVCPDCKSFRVETCDRMWLRFDERRRPPVR